MAEQVQTEEETNKNKGHKQLFRNICLLGKIFI